MKWHSLGKWVAKSSAVVLGVLLIGIGAFMPKNQVVLRVSVVMLGVAIGMFVARFSGWRWKRKFRVFGPIVVLIWFSGFIIADSLGHLEGWVLCLFLLVVFIVYKIGWQRHTE